MSGSYCYWSVVDGDYPIMMESVIESARRVGVFKDFHVWTDRQVKGATSHEMLDRDKSHYLFKFNYLRNEVKKLNYDYFIWLDADTWFVRNPGNPLRVLHGSPVHSSLESDACDPENQRPEWWDCSLKNYAALMRFKGVRSKSVFNVNGGFWIVHHDAIDTFYDLAMDFWHFCKDAEYVFTDEPPLAYATHMLCGNPYLHTLQATSDLWASDWTGNYNNVLPDGKPWQFVDYFTNKPSWVNPAIVHALRCKGALVARALGQPMPPPGPSTV